MQASIQQKLIEIHPKVVSKVNVGCGNNKIPGYWNIDSCAANKPDEVVDVTKTFPFADNSLTEILFFHTIEHIEEKYHEGILMQFHRALIPDGELYISYPEFSIVATNYMSNYKGKREFWKHTIYGLQRAEGDYHVSLMDSPFFVELLKSVGFKDIMYKPEEEPWNTILFCKKGEAPLSYEDIIGKL